MSEEKKSEKLNPKQERFAIEYIKDMNNTKAAERAGYSKTSCRTRIRGKKRSNRNSSRS